MGHRSLQILFTSKFPNACPACITHTHIHIATLTLQISHYDLTLRTESHIHLDRLLSQFLLRVGDRVWGGLYLGER